MDIIGGQGSNRQQQPGAPQPSSGMPPEGASPQPQGVAFRSIDGQTTPSVSTDASQGSSNNLSSLADSLANQPAQTQGVSPDTSQPSAASPKPAKKKGKILKKVLIGFLAVALLAGAGAGGFFLGLTQGKSSGYDQGKKDALTEYQKQVSKEDSETPATPSGNQEVPDEIPAKLTLGNEVDPEYKEENLEGVVGRQITASDGLVMMVTSIERNFKTDDANYKLADGRELIKVNFLLGNIAKDKAKDISNFNFRLVNSKGAQLTPENIAKYENKFDTVKIDRKGQVTLAIVYAVDKGEKPLSFTRIQTYRLTSQNREVTTKMTVVLDK